MVWNNRLASVLRRKSSSVVVGACCALLPALGCDSSVKSHEQAPAAPSRTSSDRTSKASQAERAGFTPNLYGEGWFDDSGYFFVTRFTGEVDDPNSLEQISKALQGRARRGIDHLRGILAEAPVGTSDASRHVAELHRAIGALYMYQGEFEAATREFEAARDAEPADSPLLKINNEVLLGMADLRRGEVENCVACCVEGSCIFPLVAAAIHAQPSGSRGAIQHFSTYLKQRPDDIGVRWLMNVAYMTLGEYPDKVPKDQLIPLEPFLSKIDVGAFPNVSARLGLDPGGNMAGGSILDDFNGDGRIDVFTSTADPRRGARLFINRGDGSFDDQSKRAGLTDQIAALNCNQADFDNDGDLDVFLMRGAWEKPIRPTLLRNEGDGRFTDVTLKSGVGTPIASQASAWGDYDNDGDVDLFVAGEYLPNESEPGVPGKPGPEPDPRNLCRLFRNDGNGTFTNVAEAAGVLNARRAKGAVWGDYDNDGWLDLYVSNAGQENRLYHNNGNGTFADVAPEMGVTEPIRSFACWFFDYDNDGRLDIFCNGFSGTLNNTINSHLGRPTGGGRPRLYRNEGSSGFRDVTREAGLDHVWLVMGSNFGDIDNDGYLDMYLGTGQPAYFYVVPNVMLKNVDGKRFEDVTTSSRTGHLQKGHGISFADWDRDGDVDIFLAAGGATPGDEAHNVLFQNPGHGNHWLNVKLVGTRSNRAAIGAEVRVDTTDPVASRFRVIGSGSSFGGNSLATTIGLGKASLVKTLEVHWPTSRTRQTFHDIPADKAIEITEGVDKFRVLDSTPIPLPPDAAGTPKAP
jgi:FG-GAP-like repeat/ASPIC and UnbV